MSYEEDDIEKHWLSVCPNWQREKELTPKNAEEHDIKKGKENREPSSAIQWAYLFFIGVQAFLLFFQLLILQQQTNISQQTVDVTTKQVETANLANQQNINSFIATQRPWIPPNVQVEGPLTWGPNGATITLRFVLRNIGLTPAMNVFVYFELYPMGADFPRPVEKQKSVSDRIRQSAGTRPIGYTIFPGETLQVDSSKSISRDDIKRIAVWIKKTHGDTTISFIPVIVGAISYRFASGDEEHQTGFIFHLAQIDPKNSSLLPSSIYPEKGDVPASLLRLIPDASGSGVTD